MATAKVTKVINKTKQRWEIVVTITQIGSIFTNYALQRQKWAQIMPDILFGPCMVGFFGFFLNN